MANDFEMENLLTAMNDALLAEASQDDIRAIARAYEAPQEEVDSLFHVMSRLHNTLVMVKPKPSFSARLKRELLASYDPSLVGQLRRLPARVQLAALLVFLGGFIFFSRRRQETSLGEAALPEAHA
jgi:hypothetical protein